MSDIPTPTTGDPVRPGYLTTEFWLMLVHLVLSVLVTGGFVATTDMSKLEGSASSAVVGVFAIVSFAVMVMKYIQGRVDVKTAASAALVTMHMRPYAYLDSIAAKNAEVARALGVLPPLQPPATLTTP